MARKVSDLLEESGSATIETAGGSFGIRYHAWWESRFTDEDWDRFKEMNRRQYLLEALPRLLVSWELVDNDDQPVPITAEAMEQHQIPTRLLGMIESAIVETAAAGKGNASSSPAG